MFYHTTLSQTLYMYCITYIPGDELVGDRETSMQVFTIQMLLMWTHTTLRSFTMKFTYKKHKLYSIFERARQQLQTIISGREILITTTEI